MEGINTLSSGEASEQSASAERVETKILKIAATKSSVTEETSVPATLHSPSTSVPNTSVEEGSSVHCSSEKVSTTDSGSTDRQSVSVIKRAQNIASTEHAFKIPSQVRQVQNTVKNQGSVSPLSSKLNSLSVEPSKSKKPSVKIASFAKTSDTLKSASLNEAKVSKQSLTSGLTTVSSRVKVQNISQSTHLASITKQLTSQTSLPTPALNEALRSVFKYDSKSNANDASPMDENEDEEEEEILVYMQFDSKLDSDLLQPHTPFKIIGVDSEKPVLQLGNQVFEGTWSDTVGTAVFFEEHTSASPGDPVFMKNPPSTLTYHSKTQKALVMSRIFIKSNDSTEDNVDELDSASNSSASLLVPVTSV